MATSLVRTLVLALSAAMMATAQTPTGCKFQNPFCPLHPRHLSWRSDQGCFHEGFDGRALNGLEIKNVTALTTAGCAAFCAGYRYYATEFSNECFCGTVLENGAFQVPDSACQYPCSGAPTETCGGSNVLSVYKTSFSDQEPQANYTYVGCGGEPDTKRALEHVIQVFELTRQKCLTMCAYGGFMWAGVEFGNECWCGDTISLHTKHNGTCDFPCAGNPLETCGGPNSLDFFADPSMASGTRGKHGVEFSP